MDDVRRRELELSRLAAIELRRRLNAINCGVAQLASERALQLAALERPFQTAIAEHWCELMLSPSTRPEATVPSG